MLIAVGFLGASLAAERLSALCATRLTARRASLKKEVAAASARTVNASSEMDEYAAIEALAVRLENGVRWETDSTNVLRWFADTASGLGVRLVNSRMLPPDPALLTVAGGRFERMAFQVRLHGRFGPLVQYVERVERSPYVMVVEKLSLTADRDRPGAGEIRMTVSCLSPCEEAGKVGGTP